MRLRSLLFTTLVTLASLAWASTIAAQVPPAKLNPQAPNLNPVHPLGMQRGTSLELTLTGTNLAGPTKLWTSFPAKVNIPTDLNNGKDNGKLRVRVDVPKDAPLGYHTIRLATSRGVSNFRLFCIDDLPQILEVDSNRSKKTAQAVSFPCVVVGRADTEVSDYFKITVKAGERLSFDVLGHRLGSAFDPQLTLYDGKTGRELPNGHSNDAPGCQTDPRLTYLFKQAGEYLIEIRDVMYRGGADFYYRLRIGDFPCATTPIPMAAKRGTKTRIQFAGSHLEGVLPQEILVPNDPTIDTVWVAPKGATGLYGWPVALAISDHDELVEQEPNNEPAKANRIPIPGGITAQFHAKGDVDHFVFAAKKGQRYIIEAHTHEFQSPTEVYLVLKDAKGAQLAVTNPALAPRIDFTAAADGDYFLVAEHLLYWGGPTESYRITIVPFEVDFDLLLASDRFDMAQGGVTTANVHAVRKGYTGPIAISLIGPPGLTGSGTINAGQGVNPALPAIILSLTARADLPMGPYPFMVQGKATINGKTVTRYGSIRNLLTPQLGNLQYPPRHLYHQVVAGITEKPPFALKIQVDQLEALRGGSATVTVTAIRAQGFTEAIALIPGSLPPNVFYVLKAIPKNQNQVKVEIKANPPAPLGKFQITLIGRGRYQNQDFDVASAPTSYQLVLPFELKLETTPVKIIQGGKAKIKVSAVRKAGYQGPISLQLRNLPANVSAPVTVIPANQSVVEIELTVAATVPPGDKANVNVLGTATALGNQQNATGNFVVTVLKK